MTMGEARAEALRRIKKAYPNDPWSEGLAYENAMLDTTGGQVTILTVLLEDVGGRLLDPLSGWLRRFS